MIICPTCGASALGSATLCRRCFTRLDHAPAQTAVAVAERERRVGRWAPSVPRSRRLRLGVGLVVLLVLAAMVVQLCGVVADGARFTTPTSTARALSEGGAAWSSPGGGNAGARHAIAVPALDGAEVWRLRLGSRAEPPLVAGPDAIYLRAGERELLAVDVATGRERWRARLDGVMGAAPVLAGDRLYVGLRDGRVLAIDATAGDVVWTHTGLSPVAAPAVVVDGVVYVASNTALLALDAEDGRLLGERQLGDRLVLTAPALDGDRIAVATFERVLFFDRGSGAETFHLNEVFPGEGASIAIEDGRVHLATSARLLTFDGDVRLPWWEGIRAAWDWANLVGIAPAVPWRPTLWGQPLAGPPLGLAVGSGAVLAAVEGGTVIAYEAATGTARWSRDIPELATAPIVTPAGALVVAGDELALLDLVSGEELRRRALDGDRPLDLVVTAGGTYYLTRAGDLTGLR